MKAWLTHHLHSLHTAVQRLISAPLASLITFLVIGVALGLPTGLYLTLTNLQLVAGNIRSESDISLFLKTDTTLEMAQNLRQVLQKHPKIAAVRLIDRDEALRQLQASGLGDIAAGLPSNPLPHTLVLTPTGHNAHELERLAAELLKLPEVEQVNIDAEWARRLSALLQLGHDIIVMLATVLGLALAAVIGNTIRLQIYAQRDEIELVRLIGATDRFIRRSFLYFGAIQGLAGGIAAWLLITIAIHLMQDSVSRLAMSYGTQFLLVGLSWEEGGVLLAISTLLGWLGAYIAVGHTIRSLHLP